MRKARPGSQNINGPTSRQAPTPQPTGKTQPAHQPRRKPPTRPGKCQRAAQHVPAGRIGNDEDMAGVAIYLASRAGNYVVGETIAVDGGVVHAFLTESWEVDPSGAH